MYDIIIIGGGVAGYTAAIYAARFRMKTLLITKRLGGLIQDTHLVENWPGEKSISGSDLVKKMLEHVKNYDVEIIEDEVIDIEKGFTVKTKEKSFEGKTILLATGTAHRKLKVPGAQEYEGKGISYCALCDGPMFKDKVIAVVGGSDSAAKEALLLTEYAKKVYIIYRKEKIRAEPINLKRVEENDKIEIINNTNVVEIKGDGLISSVILDKEYNGSKELQLGGLFIGIGQIPGSFLANKLGLKLNEKSEIIIDKYSKTNMPGVFAAGDVTDRIFKQAITGAGEGAAAAYSAYMHLQKGE